MNDPEELALAIKAILSGLTGCCEWNDRESRRLRSDDSLKGLTPAYLKQRLIKFVRDGGVLHQVPETRPEYSHRTYYYKAIILEPDFPKGIFLELELSDKDPEVPCVVLLNAHSQIR